MLLAVAFVARGLNQPLPVVKAMPLTELFMWARIAAEMEGKVFE
ncbi:hypothetical protein [Burkholderia metallica]|nr:hypothetical protein [Burkholderia metallica]